MSFLIIPANAFANRPCFDGVLISAGRVIPRVFCADPVSLSGLVGARSDATVIPIKVTAPLLYGPLLYGLPSRSSDGRARGRASRKPERRGTGVCAEPLRGFLLPPESPEPKGEQWLPWQRTARRSSGRRAPPSLRTTAVSARRFFNDRPDAVITLPLPVKLMLPPSP